MNSPPLSLWMCIRDAIGHRSLPGDGYDLLRAYLALDTDSKILTGTLVQHR